MSNYHRSGYNRPHSVATVHSIGSTFSGVASQTTAHNRSYRSASMGNLYAAKASQPQPQPQPQQVYYPQGPRSMSFNDLYHINQGKSQVANHAVNSVSTQQIAYPNRASQPLFPAARSDAPLPNRYHRARRSSTPACSAATVSTGSASTPSVRSVDVDSMSTQTSASSMGSLDDIKKPIDSLPEVPAESVPKVLESPIPVEVDAPVVVQPGITRQTAVATKTAAKALPKTGGGSSPVEGIQATEAVAQVATEHRDTTSVSKMESKSSSDNQARVEQPDAHQLVLPSDRRRWMAEADNPPLQESLRTISRRQSAPCLVSEMADKHHQNMSNNLSAGESVADRRRSGPPASLEPNHSPVSPPPQPRKSSALTGPVIEPSQRATLSQARSVSSYAREPAAPAPAPVNRRTVSEPVRGPTLRKSRSISSLGSKIKSMFGGSKNQGSKDFSDTQSIKSVSSFSFSSKILRRRSSGVSSGSFSVVDFPASVPSNEQQRAYESNAKPPQRPNDTTSSRRRSSTTTVSAQYTASTLTPASSLPVTLEPPTAQPLSLGSDVTLTATHPLAASPVGLKSPSDSEFDFGQFEPQRPSDRSVNDSSAVIPSSAIGPSSKIDPAASPGQLRNNVDSGETSSLSEAEELTVGDIFPRNLDTNDIVQILTSVERSASLDRKGSRRGRSSSNADGKVPNEQLVSSADLAEINEPFSQLKLDANIDSQLEFDFALPSLSIAQAPPKSAISAKAPLVPVISATQPKRRAEQAPAPLPRMRYAPKVGVSFASQIIVYDTYSAGDYDRRPEPSTCNRLTPLLAQQIKQELNTLKLNMPIHELSRSNTHFF